MENPTSSPPKCPPGRPRSFDREAALERAMLAFWRHGYESTSISDLKAAMGVTAPSIYAAFGDKRTLFLEAVERYVGNTGAVRELIAGATSAREAAQALLTGSAVRFTGRTTPRGCLVTTAAASVSADAGDVQEALARIRRSTGRLLRDRIARDVDDGVLRADVDAGALADLVMAVIPGLSTLARDGASRKRLLAVVEQALLAWPEAPSGSG